MIEAALIMACLSLGADDLLIQSIAAQESAGNRDAINVNRWQGAPVRSGSREESILLARHFVKEGYTVDIGLMGINSANLERLGHTIESGYESCNNIAMGEQILMENVATAHRAGYVGDDATKVALSLYNTGTLTRGFRNGYVNKVWTIYTDHIAYRARHAALDVPWTATSDWSTEQDPLTQSGLMPDE